MVIARSGSVFLLRKSLISLFANWSPGAANSDWYHGYLGKLYDSYALFDSSDDKDASDTSRKDGGTGVPVAHEAPEAPNDRKYQIMRLLQVLTQIEYQYSQTLALYHGGNTRQEEKSIELS
jgi:hypothetical protein